MGQVNIVEDYNTAENLAISSSERMAIKTDFADMVAYKDYDLAFLAKSIQNMVIERVTKRECAQTKTEALDVNMIN